MDWQGVSVVGNPSAVSVVAGAARRPFADGQHRDVIGQEGGDGHGEDRWQRVADTGKAPGSGTGAKAAARLVSDTVCGARDRVDGMTSSFAGDERA